MSNAPASAGNDNQNKKQNDNNNTAMSMLGIDFKSNPLSTLSSSSFSMPSMTMPSFNNNNNDIKSSDPIKSEENTSLRDSTSTTPTTTTQQTNKLKEIDKDKESAADRFQREGKELLGDLNQKGRDSYNNFISKLPSTLPGFLSRSESVANDQAISSNTASSNIRISPPKTVKSSHQSSSSTTAAATANEREETIPGIAINPKSSSQPASSPTSISAFSTASVAISVSLSEANKDKDSNRSSLTLPPSVPSFNNTTDRLQKEGKDLLEELNQKGRESIKLLSKLPSSIPGLRAITPTPVRLGSIDESSVMGDSVCSSDTGQVKTSTSYSSLNSRDHKSPSPTLTNPSSTTQSATASKNELPVFTDSSIHITDLSSWTKMKNKFKVMVKAAMSTNNKTKDSAVHLEYLNKLKNHNYITSIKYENMNKKLGIIFCVIGLIWIIRPFLFIWAFFSGRKFVGGK